MRIISLLAIFTFLAKSVNAQYITFFAKKGGNGKWGIAKEVTSEKNPKRKKVSWLIKPEWEAVIPDEMRSSGFGKVSKKYFTTYKNGKYGYVWAGNEVKRLDNIYDSIFINSHKVKLNGKFAVFLEEKQLTPFEYDELLDCHYPHHINDGDFNIVRFLGLKNGFWGVVTFARNKSQESVTSLIPFEYESQQTDAFHHLIMKKNKQLYWYNLDNISKLTPAFVCDSILFFQNCIALKMKNKWGFTDLEKVNYMFTRDWDNIETTPDDNVFTVYKNGLNALLKIVISKKYPGIAADTMLKFTGINLRIVKTTANSYVYVRTEGHKEMVYNNSGVLMNDLGDPYLISSKIYGPFRCDHTDLNQYGYTFRLIDSQIGDTLLKLKENMKYVFQNQNELGNVLYFYKTSGKKTTMGIYHHATRSWLEPIYDELSVLQNKFLMGAINRDFIFYKCIDFKKMQIPFSVVDYKIQNGINIRDINNNWYRLDENLKKVDASSLIRSNYTAFPGMIIQTMENGKFRISMINNMQINDNIDSYRWLKTDEILEVSKAGSTKLFVSQEGKVTECKFKLAAYYNLLQYITPSGGWHGKQSKIPVAVIDSAKNLKVYNLVTNECWEISDTALKRFDWAECSFGKIFPLESIVISRNENVHCTACENGYHAVPASRIIKGKVSYETVKKRVQKSRVESVWNPYTRSYEYRTIYETYAENEIKETRQPDEVEYYTQYITCQTCEGKSKYEDQIYYKWDGKALKKYNYFEED